MADNMIKFYRGQLANLPEVGTLGAMYITTDEGAIYYGTGEGMKRLGDFVQVANVASLPANGANSSALYYCAAENILAKWNGSSWSQINKDTGMTAVEVVGDGNAVTAAEYNAETRKLTMTKGATYATPAVVDSKIATAVGTLGNDANGNAYADVKAYVDAKTAGIATDAALSELQGKVEANEDAIEALNGFVGGSSVDGQIDAKIEALDLANTYDAKGAAEAVQGDLDAYKESNAEAVAAAKKAGDDAQTAVDTLAAKVGTVPEDKTVVEMISEAQTAATYDDTAVRGLITNNANAIDAIAADYLKAADKTELSGAIALKADKSVVDAIAEDYLKATDKNELEGKITAEETARKSADDAQVARIAALEGQITGLSGAMHFKGVENVLPEDVTNYVDGDVIIVGEKEYVFNGGKFVELGDVSAEGDRIAALEMIINGKEADGENAAVPGLVADVAANAAAIAKEAEDRAAADKTLSDRIDAIHAHDNKDVLDGIDANKVSAWDAAQANVIEAVKVNGVELTVTDKAVDIAVPTGALASKDEVAKADLADALAQEIDAKAVAKDVEDALDKKVDKVEGKSLVADTEITKLAGVSAGANKVEASEANGKIKIDGVETAVYTHPEKHLISEVDGLETVLGNKLEASDIADKADKATTLDGYGITDAYTKAEIEALLTWSDF